MPQLLFVIIIANLAVLYGSSRSHTASRQGKYWMILSILIISFCTALIIPKTSYDLTRHYEHLTAIRNSGMGIWKYIFHGAAEISDYNYRSMYTFNALSYIIGRYLPKETFPLISLLLCYGIFGYILHDYRKKVQLSNFFIATAVMVSNCLMPILYVYSNVRNQMAVSIMALAIYQWIYKRKKMILFIVLSLLAGTIHPIALAAIPFLILSNIKPGIIGILLVGVIPFLLYPLMNAFRYSGTDFLRYIGIKFYNYTFVHEYSQGYFFFFASIAITTVILLLSLVKKKREQIADQRFVNFLFWYCIFSLANIKSYQIVMRLPYLFGVLSPVIIHLLFDLKDQEGWRAYIIQAGTAFSIFLSGLALVQNYLWLA